MRFRMIDGDRVRDIFEQRRLTGFRRRDDQRALAFADRAEQVDDARGELRGADLELVALVRVDRRALFERAPSANLLGQVSVDTIDADEPVILLALLRAAHLAFDQVSAAKFEAADLRLADVDVFRTDDVAVAA
jgi:hypothetical protein